MTSPILCPEDSAGNIFIISDSTFFHDANTFNRWCYETRIAVCAPFPISKNTPWCNSENGDLNWVKCHLIWNILLYDTLFDVCYLILNDFVCDFFELSYSDTSLIMAVTVVCITGQPGSVSASGELAVAEFGNNSLAARTDGQPCEHQSTWHFHHRCQRPTSRHQHQATPHGNVHIMTTLDITQNTEAVRSSTFTL